MFSQLFVDIKLVFEKTIAVTFSEILHREEESVTIAMIECMFDKRRERRASPPDYISDLLIVYVTNRSLRSADSRINDGPGTMMYFVNSHPDSGTISA
ncbi:Hypothetical predicted protein [Scomber scombrus]|uniref:Uncharacterized protein n=1 Tax=Scomber scombrus TaxID=13677 RepID=A0AAV1Q3W8_SCOSC